MKSPDPSMPAEKIFSSIYANNDWICGSGEGSTPANTMQYRQYLQKFLSEKGIRTVVDFGCGDWQFCRLMDWSNVRYLGIDIVPAIIRKNRQAFGREHISFIHAEAWDSPLPAADLLIVKDVLQHWPIAMIQSFLRTIDSFRYALITNCTEPATNSECGLGGYRGIDLLAAPFHVACSPVLTYDWYSAHHGKSFQKTTFLYARD